MRKKPRKDTPTAFIQDRLAEQVKNSEKYRKRFFKTKKYGRRIEQTKDPEIVIKFIRETPFALKEEWVVDVIISWLQMGKFKLIKRAFLTHPGERVTKYEKAALDFFLCERIDRLVAQGMTHTEAFEKVEPIGYSLSPGRIGNIYHAKKKGPKMYVQV